ncbi:pyridoxal phosphate-dependent aminotransferase [Limnochorda pilosa]|uniref:Aminotransferase n=1 Tax=Limnochorda pilosa TaxID=1555112 RepID=A0A0K2SIH0_LIMPI|nr:pyridoxal phosphate-dependent aminotransferase [Limnochorda pilosa]BAS26634.1 aminotransferase class I/II [Limnochorda pilosa]
MKPLSRNAAGLAPQGIRAVMELARQVPGCIHLELGEPDFPTPPHIVEAAVAAAREGWHKYTPNAGLPELREAVARRVAADDGLAVEARQVCIHPGAVTGIASALMALVEPGDEVLVPALSWPNATMFLELQGARAVPYPLPAERGFLPDPESIGRLVGPRTKVLLLNTPANPTGAVFPESLVRDLVEVARAHDLWILSDEIYARIVFDASHVSPARFAPERTVVVSGLSKAYAMTGWRIGYTISPRQVADLIVRLQEPLISCTNTIAQRAALAALDGPQACVAEMRDAYHRRRDRAVELLATLGLPAYRPQGAFYLMVPATLPGEPSTDAARRMVLEQGVAVAPGSAFGTAGEGLVRVSLASSEADLSEGLRRLAAHMAGERAAATSG